MIGMSSACQKPVSIERQDGVAGEACVFKGCRGFYHAGVGPVGVVLCSPWGFEDLAMRKSWRLLAEAVAGAGFPCLRFDYPCTGNSLGAMIEATDVAQWTNSIGDAADFLRAYSGVKRFVFIGQSLGAALAAEAAAARSDVAALLLIAPVVKGRAYARELAVTSRMVADQVGIQLELQPGEGLSVLGFSLSKSLVESLNRLDVTKSGVGAVADVVVFDREDRKQGAEVSEHFRRHGIAARLEIVPPYHLFVSDATTIQPLPASTAAVVSALRGLFPTPASTAPVRVPLLPGTLRGDVFREEFLRFGDGGSMRGMLCHPARGPANSIAIIFLNRGLNAQIGWRRVSVDHARALAAAGTMSLRIDLAGLGESPDSPDRPEPLIYADELVRDVSAAVDVVSAMGHRRVALVGVCSGAYTALATAAADPRITDLVVVNAQRLVWNPAEKVEDVIRFGLRSVNDYVGDIRSRGALRKLIRSRKRIVPALWFLVRHRAAALKNRLPLAVRSTVLRDPMARRVTRLFEVLLARGTRVSLIYSDRDPGLREVRAYFGPQGRNLNLPNVSFEIIPDADHNLTTTRASDRLLDHLIRLTRDTGTAEPEASAIAQAAEPQAAPRSACVSC